MKDGTIMIVCGREHLDGFARFAEFICTPFPAKLWNFPNPELQGVGKIYD
jgi:hypothetical protein